MRSLAAILAALAPSLGAAAPTAAAPHSAPEWLGPPPPASPQRVVSLAPSLTDLAIALGRADRLVGVTRYDDQPEVAKLPRVGGFLDPSLEAVMAVRPDLVLWHSDGSAFPAVRRIAELGTPVLAIPLVGIGDVLAAARLVGRTLGDERAGERLASDLEKAIARTRDAAERLPRVRALFVVGREPLVVAGPGSYADELLRLAGGTNAAAADRPWPVYPLEKAVADDPQMVIDAAVLEPPQGLSRLAAIPAVRQGRVVRLRSDDALRPGPRLGRALTEIFRALHPEAAPP